MLILIADDQKHARQSLRALVVATFPEAEILEATTGREALRLAEEVRPRLAILDVRMPDLDGLAAAREIRSRWPEVRILVLTVDPSCSREALAAGADAFVTKGEPPERLMSVLDALL